MYQGSPLLLLGLSELSISPLSYLFSFLTLWFPTASLFGLSMLFSAWFIVLKPIKVFQFSYCILYLCDFCLVLFKFFCVKFSLCSCIPLQSLVNIFMTIILNSLPGKSPISILFGISFGKLILFFYLEHISFFVFLDSLLISTQQIKHAPLPGFMDFLCIVWDKPHQLFWPEILSASQTTVLVQTFIFVLISPQENKECQVLRKGDKSVGQITARKLGALNE